MSDPTRPASSPSWTHRAGDTVDAANAGETPPTEHTVGAGWAVDLAGGKPRFDVNKISLYRHHECLRALQRGTLRARQDFSGVPRNPSRRLHLDGAHQHQQLHRDPAPHIGTFNDDRLPHGRHSERRPTRWRISSSSGADLSSLRAYAQAIGARPGDTLVLAFRVAGTVEVRRVDADPGTTGRLEQILGRTVADRDAELATSLDCPPEEIITVLARRSDHDVLDDLAALITDAPSPGRRQPFEGRERS